MRNELCISLLLAACLAAAPASAQILDCEVNGQSVNPSNGSTTAGKTGLMRCVDRETRELRREEELRDGRFVGVKRWHEKGLLRREYSVNERGNRDGRSREWNASGVLVLEEHQSNAAGVGLERRWRDDGTLRSVAHWGEPGGERRTEALSRMEFNPRGALSELRCGPQPRLDDEARLCGHEGRPAITELFNERGVRSARVTYERARLLRQETFHTDGTTSSVMENDGTRSVLREFARDGVKRKEVVRQDRQRVLEQEYSERGTLIAEKRWSSEGWLERDAQWYLNGQPRRVQAYEAVQGSRGPTALVEKEFHDNGKPSYEGRFLLTSRGGREPVGAHRYFDEAGRLSSETTFDDKGRPVRERVWDENGRLARDEEVYEDGSRKSVGR